MNIPFRLIGSKDLHTQIVQDIDSLIDAAKDRKLIPMMLAVGSVFIEIAAAQTVLSESKTENWDKEFKNNPNFLADSFKEKKRKIYLMCLKAEGKVGEDVDRKIDIYFDPDEEYMRLTCVDKNSKAKDNEPSTGEGYPIMVLHFKPEDILPDYKFELS